jgi:O-antigen/teichoic acid export membrane protein
VITGIASFATFGLTQWWLAKYIGVSQMAEYALAMKFAMVTAFVFSPFTLWWQPRRFALLNENEGIAANARIASMGVAISFIAGLAVAIAGDVAIKLLTPEVYHEAGLYLPWLSMMWAIKNVGELLNLGCYTQKTTNKVLFIEYSSAFFAVIGYYFLIPKFGISGAIISMYIAFIVRFLLFFYFSQKVLYLPYPIFKLFIICFLSMVGSYVGSHIGNIVWESLSAIVLVSAISILGMWLGVVPKLKHILRR